MHYLTGQSLILLHQFLILLVDGQHLADTVGSGLSLREGAGVTINIRLQRIITTKISKSLTFIH